MKRRCHTPEQIIRKLAEGEKLLGQGQSIEEVGQFHKETHSRDLAIQSELYPSVLAQGTNEVGRKLT